MAHHIRAVPEMERMVAGGGGEGSERHHFLLSSLIMTSADLSDQTKDWSNARHSAQVYLLKYFYVC